MTATKIWLGWPVLVLAGLAEAAFGGQPAVGSTQDEPKWPAMLKQQWGLDMDRDLRNPVLADGVSAGVFRRLDPKKPVTFEPLIALGLEKKTRGGWYPAGAKSGQVPADVLDTRKALWAYAYKNSAGERESGRYTRPPLEPAVTTFDPGKDPFGLWIANDEFNDGGVYTQSVVVAKLNQRLKAQPYKAMIYPNVDAKTGRLVPGSYIIGWEYSTNDDFQDAVTRVDNVELLPADPPLPGILATKADVRKLADGFMFVEGPAWDAKGNALYFSDIPPARIMRYADGKVTVALEDSQMSNGLMFDRQGRLVACEHGGRRVSRGEPGRLGKDVTARYDGKRLNSPNDLWIDADGGIYFTDPRYGKRDDLEQDKEAVYYVAAEGRIARIVDGLVRPNGIALSPDGKNLYVVDNGADQLWRYPVTSPGTIGKGERIAFVEHPDGMTVDAEGRLYIACAHGVYVLRRDGKWMGVIATPERPANCTFGGRGWRTLFITAQKSLYAVDTLTRGWHIHLDGPPPNPPH